MQKQAFLIIAHNEFEVLQCLIDALDDSDNDIYIHIDARVKQMPSLTSKCSRLIVLENRMKVIWGHESLSECEMLLMEKAFSSGIKYSFFHILSGIHYPLVAMNQFNAFFATYEGKSILQPIESSEEEVLMRLGRYHRFMPYFISGPKVINKIDRFLWKVNLFLQKRLNIIRDYSYYHGKASNWCALSEEAVRIILSERKTLLKRFSHTFCSDEYFVSSVLGEHKLPVEYTDRLLFQEFVSSSPKVFVEEDYELLLCSNCMFGRKFTSKSISLINKIRNEKH